MEGNGRKDTTLKREMKEGSKTGENREGERKKANLLKEIEGRKATKPEGNGRKEAQLKREMGGRGFKKGSRIRERNTRKEAKLMELGGSKAGGEKGG